MPVKPIAASAMLRGFRHRALQSGCRSNQIIHSRGGRASAIADDKVKRVQDRNTKPEVKVKPVIDWKLAIPLQPVIAPAVVAPFKLM